MLADSFWRCLVGLAFAAPRGPLEIPRCRSVHTFGMRYALDLVWLDAQRRVVRVDRAVPPRRVRCCRRARSVIELPHVIHMLSCADHEDDPDSQRA